MISLALKTDFAIYSNIIFTPYFLNLSCFKCISPVSLETQLSSMKNVTTSISLKIILCQISGEMVTPMGNLNIETIPSEC